MKNLIVRAPMRVSLLGGGTDKIDWFEKHNGAVISFAVDQYVYVSIKKLPAIFDFNYRIVTSKIEEVISLDEITHPLVRECIRSYCDPAERLEIIYYADLPGSSGMGSSSAFAVALINGLHIYKGDLLSKRELAKKAIRIEREVLMESGGWQDQIISSYGGFNRIEFSGNDFVVKPMQVEYLNELLLKSLLVFTRFTRFSHDVELNKNNKDESLNYNNYLDANMFYQDFTTCNNISTERLGELLTNNWKRKKLLSNSITNPLIDDIFKKLELYSAGAKLLGAGSGGFFFSVFNTINQKNECEKILHVKDRISLSVCEAGASVVFKNF